MIINNNIGGIRTRLPIALEFFSKFIFKYCCFGSCITIWITRHFIWTPVSRQCQFYRWNRASASIIINLYIVIVEREIPVIVIINNNNINIIKWTCYNHGLNHGYNDVLSTLYHYYHYYKRVSNRITFVIRTRYIFKVAQSRYIRRTYYIHTYKYNII